MKIRWNILLLFTFLAVTVQASPEMTDELDPFDPQIEQKLDELDALYGTKPYMESLTLFKTVIPTCVRESCDVWAQVVKSTQVMYLYVKGELKSKWKVSTGVPGRRTPNFDTNPNGRIYDKYSSTKFPGGDYKNLGNMPYAVFISGGFAIHGTGEVNWPKLGKPASHGCIRIHPDNAYYFNRLVRQAGVKSVWITVQD